MTIDSMLERRSPTRRVTVISPRVASETGAPMGALSTTAFQRLHSRWGEPLFVADWDQVLMIHYEVPAELLQRDVPFELDLWDGRAFVSLVAFTLRGMRFSFGGSLGKALFRPIASHRFLNVRTYVRHNDEPGIHFLAEWLSSRLASWLGPITFSLPYRFGRIKYSHDQPVALRGSVEDISAGLALDYRARVETDSFAPCAEGSLDQWLMERYAAFNCATGRKRFFRVWHEPWQQVPVEITVNEDSLLRENWSWFEEGRLIGGNFSPIARGVQMGRPQRVCAINAPSP